MTISELIKVLEEKKSVFGDVDVETTWEGTKRELLAKNVYMGNTGVLFIDADNNGYKKMYAHPDELAKT